MDKGREGIKYVYVVTCVRVFIFSKGGVGENRGIYQRESIKNKQI